MKLINISERPYHVKGNPSKMGDIFDEQDSIGKDLIAMGKAAKHTSDLEKKYKGLAEDAELEKLTEPDKKGKK